MLDPDVETRPWEEQVALDDASYREQLGYLAERSPFYRDTVRGAGGLADITQLPLTDKRDLRATTTPENPIGAHLCAEPSEIVRIYSTSGTTGAPSFVPLTAGDLDNWVTGSARSYAASGVARGQRVVTTYNAGPFVAGAALASFDRIGATHIPVGTGNTERLMRSIELLRPEAAVLTPSYAAYLVEWAAERGIDLRGSSVVRVLVAGEPGGGEPAFRAKLEDGWGARVTEAMGIGGHRAAPLLRFRTRDHVRMWTSPCACGRTSPRVRCLGRTDDMLIVRGVNVFPSAVREVVSAFRPDVSGNILVRPESAGVKQEPPLPVSVELARDAAADPSLADAIRERLRNVLVVQTRVDLVPWGTLQRSEYKSTLVERAAESATGTV